MRPVQKGLKVCILPHTLGSRVRDTLENDFKGLVDAQVGRTVAPIPMEPGASAYPEWCREIDRCDVVVVFCTTAKPVTWALVGYAISRCKPMLFFSEQDNFPFEVRSVISAAAHAGVECEQGLPRTAQEAYARFEQFVGGHQRRAA